MDIDDELITFLMAAIDCADLCDQPAQQPAIKRRQTLVIDSSCNSFEVDSVVDVESLFGLDYDDNDYDGDDERDDDEDDANWCLLNGVSPSLTGTQINDLNQDCLASLFLNFSFTELLPLRRVCRRWRDIVDQELVRKKRVTMINSYAHETFGVKITNDDEFKLTVVVPDAQSHLVFQLVPNFCPEVFSVDFIFITIDETIVDTLTARFADVVQLNFCHALSMNEAIISRIVARFGRQLQSVNFRDCDINEDCLKLVVANAPQLTFIDVSGNPEVSCESFLTVAPQDNNQISSVRALQCESLCRTGIEALVRACGHNLVELTVSGAVQDNMLEVMATQAPNLKSLTVVYACTRELGSREDHLSCIGQLHLLERLSLQEVDAYYGSLDNKSLKAILKGCPKLKHLEVHLGSGEEVLISDSSFVLISDLCPLIETLQIYYAEALTNRTLFSIAKLANLKRLELINLLNITDEGVIRITKCCPHLRKLCINLDNYSDAITNASLDACIEMCRQRPKHRVEVEFFETSINVPDDLDIPYNMILSVSWYRQTSEGRRYTEIRLP